MQTSVSSFSFQNFPLCLSKVSNMLADMTLPIIHRSYWWAVACSQISNRAVKTEASELNSGILDRQCRFLTPSLVSGRKRARRKYDSVIWGGQGTQEVQLPWGQTQAGYGANSLGRHGSRWSLDHQPWASLLLLPLKPSSITTYPRNGIPAKPFRAACASIQHSPQVRGNSVINAEPQTVMSLPTTVSFPSLIKEPLSGLPFHLPFLGLQSQDCFLLHGVTGARECWWQIHEEY